MLDLVRQIETTALHLREGEFPGFGLELEETAVDVALPTDRPLFTVWPASEVNSDLEPVEAEEVDTSVLANQVVVDPARLATRIRSLIPVHGTARLEDIISLYPLQHGAAEIVGYLALDEDDLEVTTHEHEETVIEYHEAGRHMRATTPQVEVTRRCAGHNPALDAVLQPKPLRRLRLSPAREAGSRRRQTLPDRVRPRPSRRPVRL